MVATHNSNFRIEASVLFVSAYVYTQTGITISSSQAFQKDRGDRRERDGEGVGVGEREGYEGDKLLHFLVVAHCTRHF